MLSTRLGHMLQRQNRIVTDCIVGASGRISLPELNAINPNLRFNF